MTDEVQRVTMCEELFMSFSASVILLPPKNPHSWTQKLRLV